MKKIINRSIELEKRINAILKNEIAKEEKSRMAELMVAGTEQNLRNAIDTLTQLLRGIGDDL